MTPSRQAEGLTVIGAGAGSGKTHRLTQAVTEAVDPRRTSPIPLEGLIAVTYTKKAAAELDARIRQTLIAAGAHATARELPLAQIGTVHAVCLRWLRELAIDAGLSPLTDVLPGEPEAALRQALEHGLSSELRARLDTLAAELDIRWDARVRRWDWLEPVQNVMTLARSNRIPADALPEMAERASRRLRELMGEPEPNGAALDAALAQALDGALPAIAQLDTGQKNTRDARRDLERARRDLGSGELRWSTWIRLQKTNAGKAARDALAPVLAAACRVDRHPRLHAQLHAFIVAVYEAANAGLTAYKAWKCERRLVDFVDMVDDALTVLDVPDVQTELQQRLELCVVDEFQDTSPAQLALFVKLHRLCRRSTWVGDPKQCIFEYAGADPALMEAVTSWITAAGGVTETLLDNWRSRPELVQACSQLFAAAFSRHGYSPAQVAMAAKRREPSELDILPPFGVWWLQGNNQGQAAEAMAEGVSELLNAPLATPIVDRGSGQPSPVQPGDVAVLLATNAEAEQLTAALARRGIRAAAARAGLLDTPEGTLVEAALSYVANRGDTRALAVVEALTGFCGQSPDEWLESLIVRHAAFTAARGSGETYAPSDSSAVALELDSLRDSLALLAPVEALDRVLVALALPALCARWPYPGQHASNLEALRALAARYETRCKQRSEAASVPGLLRFFAEAKERFFVGGEERASDDQHTVRGPESVTVTTYHRAKGLEWPIVVLGSLNREERRDAFSVLPESAREHFDPTDPLGGRWIRYWPWPYALQRNARLADDVKASPEGREIQRREASERVRLLYVGFTRARDHLVLAVRPGRRAPDTAWLDELCDAAGTPLLSLPPPAEGTSEACIAVRDASGAGATFPARVRSLQPTVLQVLQPTVSAEPLPGASAPARWFATPTEVSAPRLRYRISPSNARHDWPELPCGDAGEVIITGPRLPLGSESPKDWSLVGDALHAFLAADVHGVSSERRLECARRLLSASELQQLIRPADLLGAADKLRDWVERSWPGATWHRELPVSAIVETPRGHRRIDGIIDLLLEVPQGVVLVDHKSYPGRRDTWRAKAREYAPQLAAYTEALRMAGTHVLSQWISFAVTGAVVRVNQNAPVARVAARRG